MRKQVRKTRQATLADTWLAYRTWGAQNLPANDVKDIGLPDGDKNAIRSQCYVDTGEHVPNSFGARCSLGNNHERISNRIR